MNSDKQLLEQALEFFQHYMMVNESVQEKLYPQGREILAAIRARLEHMKDNLTMVAAPVQEPVALRPEDVIVETYAVQRGGFMLKPANGVRLIHKPTGTVVQCDSERSQHRNRDTAWRDLEKYLAETTPPAAQPAVPLTDEQIDDEHDKLFSPTIIPGARARVREFARAIEAAHGITAQASEKGGAA